MSEEHTPRLAELRAAAAEQGIDGVVVTPGSDLRYLTGNAVHPSERLTCLVVPAGGAATLVCPRLEAPLAQRAAAGNGVRIEAWDETQDPYELVVRALGAGVRRVAVSDRAWFVQSWALGAALPGAELVPASALLGGLRVRKSAEEVASLRRAAHAIDRVHERMGEWLRPGRSERAIGRDIADAILAEGHTSVDFVIVAAGPNSASPHHHTGDRVVEEGDVVVVDIGGSTADGYRSDCTRTYAVRRAPADAVATYDVLRGAQQAALDAVRPGVPCAEVDAAAREPITAAGWGAEFTHRTGHGIGLDGHEDPYLVGGNQTALVAGMAFSVEPGIYLEGRFGMRLEDIVVCGPDGADVLNRCGKELRILG